MKIKIQINFKMELSQVFCIFLNPTPINSLSQGVYLLEKISISTTFVKKATTVALACKQK